MLIQENRVWEIDPQSELEQAEAQADSAVLATQGLERARVEDLALFPKFGLSGDRVHVVRAMHQETPVSGRAGMLEQPLFEPVALPGSVVGQRNDVMNTDSRVICARAEPSSQSG